MSKLTNLEDVARLLETSSLGAFSPAILPLAKPAIRILAQRADHSSILIGASMLGGVPDLPTSLKWPDGLVFIGQIHLPDIAAYDILDLLPHSGWLYFFYAADDQPWGFDPRDRGSWQVLYFDGPHEQLRRTHPALSVSSSLNSCTLKFDLEYTLPFGWDNIKDLELSQEDTDRYFDMADALSGRGPYHQLLGNPFQIQNDMRLECQLVSNGLYCGDSSGYNDPRRFQLEAGAADWMLLCQIDSDDDLQTMWGDCGMIYYWIRKQDLAARQFDRTWLVLQCS